MKKILLVAMLFMSFVTLTSCSSQNSEVKVTDAYLAAIDDIHQMNSRKNKDIELLLLDFSEIQGLNKEEIDTIRAACEEKYPFSIHIGTYEDLYEEPYMKELFDPISHGFPHVIFIEVSNATYNAEKQQLTYDIYKDLNGSLVAYEATATFTDGIWEITSPAKGFIN